jgi:hypothetical protein
LRRIFVPKREEVAGGWIRLHNEELHRLYASPNIIRVVKLKTMRWAGHEACTGETHKIFWLENEGKRPVGEVGVDGRIILQCIVDK